MVLTRTNTLVGPRQSVYNKRDSRLPARVILEPGELSRLVGEQDTWW
jgi:hypothetical protein